MEGCFVNLGAALKSKFKKSNVSLKMSDFKFQLFNFKNKLFKFKNNFFNFKIWSFMSKNLLLCSINCLFELELHAAGDVLFP